MKDYKKLLQDADNNTEILSLVSEMHRAGIDINKYLGEEEPLFMKIEKALAAIPTLPEFYKH